MSDTQHASVKLYLAVWALLMLLLAVTVGVAYVHLGIFNTPVALTIATVKAVVVVLYFMHVRYDRWLVWLFAVIGFIFLGHMLIWISADYATRDWLDPAASRVERSESAR